MPDLIVTLTAAQAQRVADAIGKQLNYRDAQDNPRPATLAEAKQYVIGCLRGVVVQEERRAAERAIADTAFDPT